MREKLVCASGDKLYIVIPAYNEAENLMRIVEGWYPVVEKHNGNGDSRLVIIDDGSTDDTFDLLKEYANARPLMEVVHRKNSGHGPTVLYGYRYAIDAGADYIFQTDSDGQTLPSEFEQFWNSRNYYDVLIGWRNNRMDGRDRVIVTRTLRKVINMTFHVDCVDANTPYRLMKASVLAQYIDLVPRDFFLSNVLLTVIFTKKKCTMKYIPITFRPRQGGENTIDRKKIMQIGRKALHDFRELNRKLDA